METILITGGTGLVGKQLSRHLNEHGYNVIILTRKLPKKGTHPQLSYALWDVAKKHVDVAALQKADHIIHLAGAGVMDKKWTDDFKKEIISSRADSAALLIDALKKNEHKVKTFTSASAIGYYGEDEPGKIPFEETAPADNAFLGKVCRLWEESVEPVKELDIRLVKIRIGIVMSKEGGALKEFITPLKAGLATVLGSGRQVMSWIHLDDLCALFRFALQNETMHGAYNGVAPYPVTNKTLVTTLAKKRNGKLYIRVPVPAFMLKLIMGGRSIEILKSTTVSSKKTEASGFTFHYADIDAAMENLFP